MKCSECGRITKLADMPVRGKDIKIEFDKFLINLPPYQHGWFKIECEYNGFPTEGTIVRHANIMLFENCKAGSRTRVLFVGVKHPKTKYIYVHPDDARIVHRSHEIGFGVRMARTHVANEMKALRGYA